MRNFGAWFVLGLLPLGSLAWADGEQGSGAAAAASREIRRGSKLATFGGCHDCHTPKVMTAKGPALDQSRLLSGFPAQQALPPVPAGTLGPNKWGALATNDLTAWTGPWGTSFAANLTPDATGLGAWTLKDFVKTMRSGKHLGGTRDILPPMPWFNMAGLSDTELRALFAYLKSVKPIANRVPEPIPPQ
ncbi:MAG TPA: c-type cytochrome [Steroidobacteraceae bacterium]|nr:c-type cytochrome [Steroidobacteraceae bacterium]